MKLQEARDKVNELAKRVEIAAKDLGVEDYAFIGMVRVEEQTAQDPPTVEGITMNSDAHWGLILAAQLLGFAKHRFMQNGHNELMQKMQGDVGAGEYRGREKP